jgi:hypothetical protein
VNRLQEQMMNTPFVIWYCVVRLIVVSSLEEPAASIFNPKDGDQSSRLHGITSQKTVILIAPVMTLHLMKINAKQCAEMEISNQRNV